jgi:hypothetical protein
MVTSGETFSTSRHSSQAWFEEHQTLAGIVVILLGFLARVRAASGTFLNPDEALHFRLANQLSLHEAYRQSLTASHPPLLTFILYFWRVAGTSELWLRMPLILASLGFCWMFYRWLSNVATPLAGFIGLLFVALLPPIVELSTEIRQYPLLLAFLAAAVYFLDRSFFLDHSRARNSVVAMVGFSFCLYLAMASHYSAFLFAAALGAYALLRIIRERPSGRLISVWVVGQVFALALAVFFYKTHISKLGVGESRTALQGWMSEFFLRRDYFDRAHDHAIPFLFGHTFGVFQYFFGQLAVGDLMGLVFFVGVALLLWRRGSEQERESFRRLGVFLVLPFAVAAAASLAHVYPYGGTRHVAFLIIPSVAGVSVGMAWMGRMSWPRGLAIAGSVLLACIAFGKPRPPRMDRADQSRAHMADAIAFVQQSIPASDLIFTDYQTDLILGHYLCEQHPIWLEPAPANYEQFSCAGHRVVATDYHQWQFWANNFPGEWGRFVRNYKLEPGSTVWIVQMGWGIALPEDLRKHIAEFHDLQFKSFGDNIKIFKMTVPPRPPEC